MNMSSSFEDSPDHIAIPRVIRVAEVHCQMGKAGIDQRVVEGKGAVSAICISLGQFTDDWRP